MGPIIKNKVSLDSSRYVHYHIYSPFTLAVGARFEDEPASVVAGAFTLMKNAQY